jgi:hypothetical protein
VEVKKKMGSKYQPLPCLVMPHIFQLINHAVQLIKHVITHGTCKDES